MSFDLKRTFAVTKECSRFTSIASPVDERMAAVYMKLRKDGCDKKSAKKFVCRSVCKTDTTKMKDGPVNCRTLRLKKTPYYFVNHGWSIFKPVYNLENGQVMSKKELLLNENEEKLFKEHFYKQENKIKEDYRKKIAEIQKYFEGLNECTKFTGLDQKELIAKLHQERARSRSSKAKSSRLKYEDIQFKLPAVNLQDFDEEFLDMLNFEVHDIGYLRFSQQDIEKPSKIESNDSLDQPVADEISHHPSPLIKLESITESVEGSIDQAQEPEKKLKSEPKRISTDELINAAFNDNEKQKNSGTLMKEVQNQMKDLSKILDQGNSELQQKKFGNFSRSQNLQVMNRRPSGLINLSGNKTLAKEFNQVNYVFGEDEDSSPIAEITPSIPRRKKPTSSPVSFSGASSLAISTMISLSKGETFQKEFDRYRNWQNKQAPEINSDSLNRKKREMDEIVQKYREKLKPLEISAPGSRRQFRSAKSSQVSSVRSASTADLTQFLSKMRTPAQTPVSFFPSCRVTPRANKFIT